MQDRPPLQTRLALESLGWSINWRGRLSRSQCVSVQTRVQVIRSTYPFCRAHILVYIGYPGLLMMLPFNLGFFLGFK
jgi:hypothetical protein